MNKNSLNAYKAIGAHLDSHYLDIYEILLSRGFQTAWEIAANSYGLMTEAQVYRRLSEMVKGGWIEKLDWDTITPTGCYASTYWIKHD